MRSSSRPHAFMGVTEQGLAAIVKTRGNPDVHVILRGGNKGTNYDKDSIKNVETTMKSKGINVTGIMIDASRKQSPIQLSVLDTKTNLTVR